MSSAENVLLGVKTKTYLGHTKSIDIDIILKSRELAKQFCLYVDGVLRVFYMSLLWKY